MRANYNARPCKGERKAAGARNNGKNNAQSNRKQSEDGGFSSSVAQTQTPGRRCRHPGALLAIDISANREPLRAIVAEIPH
jgi:hypothetical protein